MPGCLLEKGRKQISRMPRCCRKNRIREIRKRQNWNIVVFCCIPQWAKLSKFNIAQRGRQVLSISFLTYNSINCKVTRWWLWGHCPKWQAKRRRLEKGTFLNVFEGLVLPGIQTSFHMGIHQGVWPMNASTCSINRTLSAPLGPCAVAPWARGSK